MTWSPPAAAAIRRDLAIAPRRNAAGVLTRALPEGSIGVTITVVPHLRPSDRPPA